MTSFVVLTLDTQTSVEASLSSDGGTQALLELAVPDDVVEVKVWGHIDPTNPANADFAELEVDAEWLPISASFVVVLDPADGEKTINVRVRDDVDNEATDYARIFVGTPPSLPEPTGPPRLTSPPEVRDVRVVITTTGLGVSTQSSVSRTSVASPTGAVISSTSSVRVVQEPPPDRRVISYRAGGVSWYTTTQVSVSQHSNMQIWHVGISTTGVIKRDGMTIEQLIALDLL